eukprot:IDg2343t1
MRGCAGDRMRRRSGTGLQVREGADAQGAVRGGVDAWACRCAGARMRMCGYFDALVRWHASARARGCAVARVRGCADAQMRGCIDTVVRWHQYT